MAFGATGIVAAPRLICWQWDSEMTAVEPVPPAPVTSLHARTARRPGLDVPGPPRCGKSPPGARLFPHALLSLSGASPSARPLHVLCHRDLIAFTSVATAPILTAARLSDLRTTVRIPDHRGE